MNNSDFYRKVQSKEMEFKNDVRRTGKLFYLRDTTLADTRYAVFGLTDDDGRNNSRFVLLQEYENIMNLYLFMIRKKVVLQLRISNLILKLDQEMEDYTLWRKHLPQHKMKKKL